ncbi:hypothetical protein [Myxacorys almedinensis]|uniref:Uncharacterized protein n=1 Tax=Myxacorys almedinensis A TaxID=2690445 RepID=A0A8J8CMK0_9CYAN|nr:hypothetical protein [Myxacorys almedinensis]NDJ18770.1 hypothetical protein [Myxacorys almedinensis A]
MLKKAVVIGVCFVAIAGCTQAVSPRATQSTPERSTENRQQESDSTEQRQTRLAEDERETRKQAALSSIKQLEQQKDLLSQRMLGRQQKLSNLELRANQLETELSTYNRRVQAFILAHKNSVGCMGALGVSLDETNHYSKDVKDLAGAATLVCGAAVIANDGFRNEVIRVADQLSQASNHVKNLTSQLQGVRSQINTENASLEQEQTEASNLASGIQNYHSQLEREQVSTKN